MQLGVTYKMSLGAMAVAMVGGCGFPRPPDVVDDTGDCRLTAVGPAIARADDTITLEGTFADAVTVNFPGGASVAATVLGPHRATAVVPKAATAGDLTVTTCGSTIGPLSFRRASFALGVGRFGRYYDQANGARQSPTLETARDGHASVVVGGFLYVIGGVSGSKALDSVERALVNADGSLGAFSTVPALRLATPRQSHSAIVLGDYLYVVGGFGTAGLRTVERARVASDGGLGPFETVAGASLVVARQGHSSVVVGNHLYVIGGYGDGDALGTLERATISADGSLGAFEVVEGNSLATGRFGHTALLIGNSLYVVGGSSRSDVLQDVERADLRGDGTLGAFARVTGVSLSAPRSGHSAVALGGYLYLIGGSTAAGPLASVDRSRIDARGMLEGFAAVKDVALSAPRRGHSMVLVENHLYLLGGAGTGALDTLEWASINVGGGLGTFAPVVGNRLVTPRFGHVMFTMGRYLYVLLGEGAGERKVGMVERALVKADGELGPFEPTSIVLSPGGRFIQAAVLKNSMFTFEFDGSRQRASIRDDGQIGAFQAAQGGTAEGKGGAVASFGRNMYSLGIGGLGIGLATMGSDGQLGAVVIATARLAVESDVFLAHGSWLYGIGRFNSLAVQRAPISIDGQLGAPSLATSLSTLRDAPTAVVLGDYLYVLGGAGSGFLRSVERAAIQADGTVAGFTEDSATLLAAGRHSHTMVVLGNYLYVVGGYAQVGSEVPAPTEGLERAVLE